MRGIGLIPRSAARAILAGALLASAAFRPALAAKAEPGLPDETAMVVPRVKLPAGASPLGLPQPLPPSEAARLRRIFALQRSGNIPAALAETGRLTDLTLLGHVLADRILLRPSRARSAQLSAWLGRYADLPDAPAIYALLARRTGTGIVLPPAPAGARLSALSASDDASLSVAPARAAFAAGRDAAALRLAQNAWTNSGWRDGEAAFVAGLARWRQGGMADAARYFEAASTAPDSGHGLRAAAAFCAARAHEHLGQVDAWRDWMRRAAAEPLVLHGMLARRVLGMPDIDLPPNAVLTEADLEAVAARPRGRRAFALLQIGQPARAEAELRYLWPEAQNAPALMRALLLVAEAAGLDDLQSDLASALHVAGAEPPLPRLKPRGGFTLNPVLVYAVARVESGFAARAVSPAGAVGMMQLRPEAASIVAGRHDTALQDAGTNLRLGQRFLAYLSRTELAGDDLLRVLASYNAGPGAAKKYGDGGGDPLLFLEALPCGETRHYVQSALSYMGVYAARMHHPTPALDALAAGLWPKFSNEIRH